MTCPVTGVLCTCTIDCAARARPADLSAKRIVDEYAAKKEAFEPDPLGRWNATCVTCGERFNAALEHFCKARMSRNTDIDAVWPDVSKSGHPADIYLNGVPFTITPTEEGFAAASRALYQNVGTSEQTPMDRNDPSDKWHKFTVTDIDTDNPKMFVDGKRVGQKAPGEGGWYSRFNPQPIDIIAAWNLDHWQAEALTYLVRYDMKGGREDLEKAVWYINDLIKRKYGED